MEGKIRVVTKLPNEEPKVEEIENTYEKISSFCGGYIDMVEHPKVNDVTIVCNDSFLCNGMEPNIVLPERKEVFCGPLIFCGYDPETGDSISLTEEQEKKVLSYIERNNLHHMSLEGAYRYCEVIGPYQKAVDEIQKDEKEMEA